MPTDNNTNLGFWFAFLFVFSAREKSDVFHHDVCVRQRQYFRMGVFGFHGEHVGVQVFDHAVDADKPVSSTIDKEFQVDSFQVFHTLHGDGYIVCRFSHKKSIAVF